MTHPLLKNWKVQLLIGALIISAVVIAVKGIQLGIDFKGGTVLTFQFSKPLTPSEMQQSALIISKRLDLTGLSSISVKAWGNQYLIVELAETDPQKIKEIVNSVLRQGKFETVVDGNVVLTGKDIVAVDPPVIYPSAREGYNWRVPFQLSADGVKRFYTGVHGKCDVTGQHCAYTFMYIDRPAGAVLLIPKDVYMSEKKVPIEPNVRSTATRLDINEFILNAGVKAIVVDKNTHIDVNALKSAPLVILHPELNYLVPLLKENNIPFKIVEPRKNVPWIWTATNLQSVVRLTPGVTNVSPSNANPELVIEGWAPNKAEAQRVTTELKVLLESGALPASLKLVSESRVPATYGEYLFYTFLLALIAAMIAVATYIALRYREWKVVGPIILTMASEIFMIFAFAALVSWKIDVASMVGIVASTGTGVDDQIVITDELIRGRKKEGEQKKVASVIARVKRAFFIIFASASALTVAMIPVWFSGIPALKGFALTTIVGVLIGVFITRPAFAEILKYLLHRKRA